MSVFINRKLHGSGERYRGYTGKKQTKKLVWVKVWVKPENYAK